MLLARVGIVLLLVLLISVVTRVSVIGINGFVSSGGETLHIHTTPVSIPKAKRIVTSPVATLRIVTLMSVTKVNTMWSNTPVVVLAFASNSETPAVAHTEPTASTPIDN